MAPSPKKVVIIGSGLAGMAAAVRLVDASYDVCILERKNHIGGRTASWNEDGMDVESGLHRYLGFYNKLPQLMQHVGVNVDDILCWEDEVEIRHPAYDPQVLGLAPLHKPVETFRSLFGHSEFFSFSEKTTVTRMFAAGAALYVTNPTKLDHISLKEYAYDHGVRKDTLEKLLIPLSEGIFFVPIDHYSAYAFFGLFLSHATRFIKTRVGAFNGGMTDVMINPIADYIEQRGGTIEVNTAVKQVTYSGNSVVGVELYNGRKIKSDAVILTAAFGAAKKIVQNSFYDHPHFRPMMSLLSMPAVTMQFELSEPVLPVDRTTFGPTTALASFSEQSRTTFTTKEGRFSVIMSMPERYIHMPAQDLCEIVIKDATKLGMDLKNLILDYRKIVEADDFYMLSPGAEALRPTQQTPINGFALAGDYTKQPYMATMEGAVHSGNLAARHIIDGLKSS